MTSSLAGRTVVITRAEHQAEVFTQKLRELGADPIVMPVIALADPPDGGAAMRLSFTRLANYDWLVITSANTVERLPSKTLPSSVKVAAIGPGTAEALRDQRFEVDLLPPEYVAESLLKVFPDGNGRVLLPRAVVAREVLPEGLRRKGWKVDVVDAYETVGVEPDPAVLERALCADVVTFTAPSTVKAFQDFSGDRLPTGAIACIGPVTAAAARKAGMTVSMVAPEHTVDGLIQALQRHYGGESGV